MQAAVCFPTKTNVSRGKIFVFLNTKTKSGNPAKGLFYGNQTYTSHVAQMRLKKEKNVSCTKRKFPPSANVFEL